MRMKLKKKGKNKNSKRKEGMKMKYVKRIIILAILLVIYIYVAFVTLFPDSIVLMQGEKFSVFSLWGIQLKETSNRSTGLEKYPLGAERTKVVGSIPEGENTDTLQANTTGTMQISFSLFDTIPIKEVSVSVIPKTKVIPLRKCNRFKTIYEWRVSSWYERNRRKQTL